MAYTEDWEDLGRKIADMVDQAVNHRDFQKLNENIRRTVDRGAEAVRRAVDGREKTDFQSAPKPKDLTVYYGKTGNLTTRGLAKTIGGGLLAFMTLGLSIAATALEFVFGVGAGGIGGWLALGSMAAGGGLVASGVKNLNQVSRFKAYRKALGDKTHCALKKLARAVGKSEKFVRKEVLTMIGGGLFPEGHLDNEETMLIISDETYRLFETSRLQLEQRQRQAEQMQPKQPEKAPDSRVREVLDRGEAFIREIRRCNDRIPGQEISAKIDRMELIVDRIFDRAETNPEIIPDLKKMMDYYLPMTVKLLNAYADMDEQPHQGENIRNAKAEIEQSLDTLNQAFEKLLDDLFADTALDVSSDISVLQTLLAQEGLTDHQKLR